jgi:putative oxidoreductase
MDVVGLVGRVLLVLVFLDNGWAHVSKRDQMVPFGRMIGAPMAEISVPLTGVMMLVGVLPVAGYLGHAYWKETDPMARAGQKAHFWKNIALAGAALFVFYCFEQFGDEIGLTLGNSPSLFG